MSSPKLISSLLAAAIIAIPVFALESATAFASPLDSLSRSGSAGWSDRLACAHDADADADAGTHARSGADTEPDARQPEPGAHDAAGSQLTSALPRHVKSRPSRRGGRLQLAA